MATRASKQAVDFSLLEAAACNIFNHDPLYVPIARKLLDATVRYSLADNVTLDNGMKAHVDEDKSLTDTLEQYLCLWYRARVQLMVFEAFMLLHERDLVSLEGLVGDICIAEGGGIAFRIGRALTDGFEAPRLISRGPPKLMWRLFCNVEPMHWLAKMILRSTKVDSLEVFAECLRESGVLGRFDEERFHGLWTPCRKLEKQASACDKRASSVYADPKGQGHWGWFLPMGFVDTPSREEVYEIFMHQYNLIENLGRKLFRCGFV